MSVRAAALIIGVLDTGAWLVVAMATFLSGSDAATRGLDNVAGLVVTAVFLLTGLPALVLAWRGYWPRLALGLSLAFPLAFAVAFAGVVLSLA